MTGFGGAAVEEAGVRVSVEARSVNGKGLDIHLRLPAALSRHELACREAVRSKIRRGRVDVSVTIEFLSPQAVNVSVSESVVRAASEAAARLKKEGFLDRGLTWSDLEALPGAVSAGLSPQADARSEAIVKAAIEAASLALLQTRLEEGARLKGQFEEARAKIKSALTVIRGFMPRQVEYQRQKLSERVAEMNAAVEANRIEQEVVMAAQKCDISEEVVRLEAHMEALGGLLSGQDGDLGRRLDHLVQEVQRETSTLLAKSAFLELTRAGMGIRLETEKMKEQAQNVA